MTYLSAKTPIKKERWYYVAATYDGQTMRLYVNGELEAESNAQSGDIVYPVSRQLSGRRLDRHARANLHGGGAVRGEVLRPRAERRRDSRRSPRRTRT